jgi:hypothetical protein
MSFGYSVGELLGLTQLAWKTVQNTRKACGEHDELTREGTSLHFVLRRVEQEAAKPDSVFNRTNDGTNEELGILLKAVERFLVSWIASSRSTMP